MAAEDILGDSSKHNAQALSAVLFMAASTNALDAFSALNSSPWTAESFGGDPEKAKACREYVYHAIAVTSFYGFAGSIIGHNWWPIIGTVVANAYMYWLYMRALGRAQSRGSTTWES
jgi:hypothetical protein